MRHSEPHTLHDALQEMIKKSPHQHKFLQASLSNLWKQHMPKSVIQQTRRFFLKQNKLFIEIDSAPLRQELQLSKPKLMQLFKQADSNGTIDEIVIL